MVKNTQGGNKSKNVARKHSAGKTEKRALRTSACDLERYGVVSQVNGYGMFYVVMDDDATLLGRIRNKFRGKSKRDNNICKGAVVLMGLREWEAPNFKEADLLEVYDSNEIKQLKKIPSINVRALERAIELYGGAAGIVDDGADEDGVEFVTGEDADYMADVMGSATADAKGSAATATEEIAFDDI